MRKLALFGFALSLLSLALFAATPTPVEPPAKPATEIAIYTVPGLDQEVLLKSLSKSLADKPGVMSAQADKAKGTFAVTFETAKINPDQILKALASVAPETKLQGVAPAGEQAAATHDCGKCPHHASCGAKK